MRLVLQLLLVPFPGRYLLREDRAPLYTNSTSASFSISIVSPDPFSPSLYAHSSPFTSSCSSFYSLLYHSSLWNFFPSNSPSRSPYLHQKVPNAPSLGAITIFSPSCGLTSCLYPSSLRCQNRSFSNGSEYSKTTCCPLLAGDMARKSQSSRRLRAKPPRGWTI